MPTYNYQCKSCNEIIVVLQKITDSSLKSCKKCKGDLKKIISGGTGMIFKGNGFYLTDYAKKDNKKQKLEKNESKKGNNDESSKNSKSG